MKLSIALIVKDEAKILEKCLYYGSVSGYTPCCISGSTYLTVGQTIYITVRQESGTTQSIYHDGGLTNLNIVRVR